jgi:hypothetical protein
MTRPLRLVCLVCGSDRPDGRTRTASVWALHLPGRRLAAEHPTTSGRRGHPRSLAIAVDWRIDTDATVTVLDHFVADCGTTPRRIRCDNGPRVDSLVRGPYIEPDSPWRNPYVKSFGGRLHDELLAVEAFGSLLEAHLLVGDWRTEYDAVRPLHPGLKQPGRVRANPNP